MKKAIRVVAVVALMITAQAMMAQRGMRLGGGGAPSFRAPGRGSVAPGPRVITSSPRTSTFVQPGFAGFGGVRFRGSVGFGHNPRFHVGFGPRFGNCFGGFCRGFGRGSFFGAGIPVIVPYPYSYYPYGADYSASYAQYAEPSTAVQAENSYAEGYQQGATAQQVQQLSGEVERLRAELNEKDRGGASAKPQAAVQELPLDTTLVMRNGRRVKIHNYAVVGQTIWIFDEKTATKMPVAQLDLDATKRVNEENGVLFLLPGMR